MIKHVSLPKKLEPAIYKYSVSVSRLILLLKGIVGDSAYVEGDLHNKLFLRALRIQTSLIKIDSSTGRIVDPFLIQLGVKFEDLQLDIFSDKLEFKVVSGQHARKFKVRFQFV